LQLLRSTPAVSGYAVSITKACDVQINDVVAWDNFNGFLLNFVGNPRMADAQVVWTSASASNRNGFEVDTTDSGSVTYYCNRCLVVASSAPNGVHTKGFYFHGGHLSDVKLTAPETSNLDHGAYVDFESGSGAYGGDVVISSPIFDTCQVSGASILNNVNPPYYDVKISDGWFYMLGGTGVVVNNARGVSVSSSKIACVDTTGTAGIIMTAGTSWHNQSIGTKINGCKTGIKLDAAAITNLTSNDISFATTGIQLTNSANNNNVTGNSVVDNVVTAFSADAEGFNTVVGNTFVGTTANIVNTGANYFAANSTYQTTQTPALNVTSCAGATKGTGSLNLAGTITAIPLGSCTIVMTFGAQPAETGWNCSFADQTTPANVFTQTASSTTTATITGVGTASDVLRYTCSPF
jgi:parallel beta-helix repeat protein